MALVPQQQVAKDGGKRGRIAVVVVILLVVGAAFWFWRLRGEAPKPAGPGVVSVTSTLVAVADIPVRLSAKGTVTALQSVDVRPRINATIKTVHIKEGQYVRQGERLFSLDVRTEDANLRQTEAQLAKSRADLTNAENNLRRQRELLERNYISPSAFDVVQNQVASLRAQVVADRAAIDASRVGRGYGEIVAPIAGRTGAITVYPGSLVQSTGTGLVSITQIDPINVAFTLPERELPALQKALASGGLTVSAQLEEGGEEQREGRLVFVDNSVDTASGTIRLKAGFANADGRLWPGMFVTVALSPRILKAALTVPAQAVQTGPEKKFLYVIGEGGKVVSTPIRVLLIQDGQAVVEGVAAGTRVVLEGAQNLRAGSLVREAGTTPAPGARSKP
ncbi:efflux RND transporter periplasmic adaptor subunit [Dechloromonas denitrificans]|uniref:efflux RND transporter periplasmic adaptor subunit n=1 Tax=Dechloromonas denitrificans TaxID=281362 RepID=UPI001CF92C01|nr:efflux RND transporter periplasmic adaptor subunit [Dechloromonas denitrificans]UCV02783.1 efflux RND transporter periplasmic adaptor subunit [Dechloromonas denitrificans]